MGKRSGTWNPGRAVVSRLRAPLGFPGPGGCSQPHREAWASGIEAAVYWSKEMDLNTARLLAEIVLAIRGESQQRDDA
jgi:hypothetical protein